MTEWELKGANDEDVSFIQPLGVGSEYKIGRNRQIDIVCTSPLVSRQHAIIKVDEDNVVYIKDTKSSNGIFINDIKITPDMFIRLKHLDLIGIGAPRSALEPKKDFFLLSNRLATEPERKVSEIQDEQTLKLKSFTDVIEISDSEEENTPVKNEPVPLVEVITKDLNSIKMEDVKYNHDKDQLEKNQEMASNKIVDEIVENDLLPKNEAGPSTKIIESIDDIKNIVDNGTNVLVEEASCSKSDIELKDDSVFEISSENNNIVTSPVHLKNVVLDKLNLMGSLEGDSDDDMFPMSQLFHDNDVVEKEAPKIKEEPLDTDYDLFRCIKRENVYDEEEFEDLQNYGNEFDFEDDDKKWFERLSQPNIKVEECISDYISETNLRSNIEENVSSVDEIDVDKIENQVVQQNKGIRVVIERNLQTDKKLSENEVDERNNEKVDKNADQVDEQNDEKVDNNADEVDERNDEKVHNNADEVDELNNEKVDINAVENTIRSPKLQKILEDLFGDKETVEECDKRVQSVDSNIRTVTEKIKSSKKHTGPLVIDAPFLKKGRRKAHEAKTSTKDNTKLKRKYSTEDRCKSPVPKKKSLTAADKTVRGEFEKRASSKRKSSTDKPLDNKSKKEIKEKRKERLKSLTEKQADMKDMKDRDHIKRQSAKPKVKNSLGRGGFLTDEAELDLVVPKKKFIIPKKKPIENNETTPQTLTTPIFEPCYSNLKMTAHKSPVLPSTSTHLPRLKKSVKFKPDVVLVEVHTFFIEEGNKLLPCNFKDAPIPAKHLNRTPVQKVYDESDALVNILMWNPNWLEECQHINTPPKVSNYRALQMLHTFNSSGDYFHIVTPLLMLELWEECYREWKYSKKKCVLAGNINEAKINTRLKHSLTQLTCTCYLSKWENNNNLHPNRGELIILDIMLNKNNKMEYEQKFGYVMYSHKKKVFSQDSLDITRLKKMKVSLPVDSILTITVYTKQMHDVQLEKPIRVRSISYIAPSLRTFNAVIRLSSSPLCNHILKPTIERFRIPKLTETKVAVKDKLDSTQLMAVLEAARLCCGDQPGIYMIQGPPGTGKSSVILNLIHQLLYGEKRPKGCILLCAPSNGAIDEITIRLLELRSQLNKPLRFKMLRIGQHNSIHPRVKDISLQNLVKKHLKEMTDNYINKNVLLKDDLNFRISKMNMLENMYLSKEARGEPLEAIDAQLKKAKADLELFYSRRVKEMTIEERRKIEWKAENDLIEGADIICTTLSSSVGTKIEDLARQERLNFSCCIVDEATQSNEQETLIPLMLGISRLVLVGDPAQLPATVLSSEAKNLGYGQSLFARLQNCLEHLPENPIRMLKTQYRMHAEICRFPNYQFYGGKLQTPAMLCRDNSIFYPYRIFSLVLPVHQMISNEYLNKPEANFVLMLANIILRNSKMSVGIITSYTVQKQYLTAKFEEMMKGMKNPRVDINTVDSFQGQERDIIIYSPVRYRINGFLSDHQRLNVSFTRAKYALFVCVQEQMFATDHIWKLVEADGRNRQCLFRLTEGEICNETWVTNLIIKK